MPTGTHVPSCPAPTGHLRSLSLPKGRRILDPPAAKNYFSVQLLRKTNFHRTGKPTRRILRQFPASVIPDLIGNLPSCPAPRFPSCPAPTGHLLPPTAAGVDTFPAPAACQDGGAAPSPLPNHRVVLTLRISGPKCVHRVPCGTHTPHFRLKVRTPSTVWYSHSAFSTQNAYTEYRRAAHPYSQRLGCARRYWAAPRVCRKEKMM